MTFFDGLLRGFEGGITWFYENKILLLLVFLGLLAFWLFFKR